MVKRALQFMESEPEQRKFLIFHNFLRVDIIALCLKLVVRALRKCRDLMGCLALSENILNARNS